MNVCSLPVEISICCSEFYFAVTVVGHRIKGNAAAVKVPMTRNFFISLFESAFKTMKNGVYFIVIALLVAELFKILIYAN